MKENRKITITNIEIPEYNFILRGKESKKLPVSVYASENTRFGNYSGVMRLVMERHNF